MAARAALLDPHTHPAASSTRAAIPTRKRKAPFRLRIMNQPEKAPRSRFVYRPRTEPDPLWPEAPRYCPERPFPRYRFVAGLHPHPINHPEGHSYGLAESDEPPLRRENWQENRLYLFGIDLYHAGYFWEAHEAWEQLWKQEDRKSPTALYLQGLILLSAARIKFHARAANGVRKASWLGYQRLRMALAVGCCNDLGRFLGINLPGLLDQVHRHYSPHWPDGSLRSIVLRGAPPTLVLEW